MAKTHKDIILKAKIESVIKQFKNKPEKEIIYLLAGTLNISHRTASEHFHAFKAQKKLLESGFKEKCSHDWSEAFGTAGGLCKECRLCGKTKFIKIE